MRQIPRFTYFVRIIVVAVSHEKNAQAPNETVEKPYFQVDGKSDDGTIGKLFTLNAAEQECAGLDQYPKSVDLADIVHQSEQSPLYIHFPFRAQGEAVHTLLHTDVGKDRFDNAQTPGIDALALFTIDPGLHLIDQVGWLRNHRHGKIPARGGGFA